MRRRNSLQHELTTLALTAPQVVAHRSLRMLWAADPQSPEHLREARRMVDEKLAAAQDGWLAMAGGLAAWQWRSWMELATWYWQPWSGPHPALGMARQWQEGTAQLLSQGLAPARRKVRANLRRLQRR